jgi:hypothetical protein
MNFASIFTEKELNELINSKLALSIEDLEGYSIDELGERLPEYAHPGSAFFDWPEYWDNLKVEFRILVCTKEKKYASLRRKMETAGRKSQTALVSMLAAAMATYIGVAAGVLVPFCALCLIAVLKLGKEAFCNTTDLNIPIKNKT